MNVFTRFWRYLTALLHGKLNEWEDPEIILDQAVREMKENQAKNREMAVQAITQKNNLQAEVDKLQRVTAELERKATLALQNGDRETAKAFLKQKATQEQSLEMMKTNLAAASEASEKVKILIRQEEERIRQKTAEALALKANMKQAQIQIKINEALNSIQFADNESNWTTATQRIQEMNSRAGALNEIAGTSIDAKVRELEISQMDVEADRQLAELEMKLSTGANPAANYNTVQQPQVQTLGGGAVSSNGNSAAPESDIDRQLRELEERLGKK